MIRFKPIKTLSELCGVKCIQQTKPNNLHFINYEKLKLAPQLQEDTVNIRKSTLKMIPMHFDAHGHNFAYREISETGTYDLLAKHHKKLKKFKGEMKEIDEAFNFLKPAKKENIYYRGLKGWRDPELPEHPNNYGVNIVENAKIGDRIMPDYGYSYTSFNENVPKGHMYTPEQINNGGVNSWLLEIHTPQNAKISRKEDLSQEGLFPRKAEYIVKDKRIDNNGIKRVILEYILPKNNL